MQSEDQVYLLINHKVNVVYVLYRHAKNLRHVSPQNRFTLKEFETTTWEIGLIIFPWHDTQAIARTCAVTIRTNQEKGDLGRQWKARPKVILRGWYRLRKILNSSSWVHADWFNRIIFKLTRLTLLFKSLFFKTHLNCSYVLLLYIFSIITQWASCFIKKDKRLISLINLHWLTENYLVLKA